MIVTNITAALVVAISGIILVSSMEAVAADGQSSVSKDDLEEACTNEGDIYFEDDNGDYGCWRVDETDNDVLCFGGLELCVEMTDFDSEGNSKTQKKKGRTTSLPKLPKLSLQ
jgi:hypothetical protein